MTYSKIIELNYPCKWCGVGFNKHMNTATAFLAFCRPKKWYNNTNYYSPMTNLEYLEYKIREKESVQSCLIK